MQRISQLELGILFILFHFSTATGFLMSLLFSTAAYQGWLTLIVAAAGGLLITYISIVLAKQRASEFLVHYGKELVGRWPHVILMIGSCFFFIHLAGIVLRQVTDFMVQVYLPTTPTWVVGALFAFVVTMAVRTGIETIFRCAAGFFFVIFGVGAITPFMVANELNYERSIALLTHLNAASLFNNSYPFIPWFGEMFMIVFIFPYIAHSQKTFRSLLWSTVISLIFIEISFILCFLLFGSHLSGQMTYPILEMIRFIRIGDFLENLDPVVVAIWLGSLFIKVSILLYIPVLISTQLMGLKDTRPFSFSFGAIMLGISVNMVNNTIELNEFILRSWPTFALFVECLPLIYWAMSMVKKRRANIS
ncbi:MULTISPECIES: GerAB/ArcD/ProY family transporter [unclassified Paenibacillus]|uniref:GerAB/ArcD/ProY family transporter n=1 Tax=unclassified Paenibacillus TaxID=185978 RepID=UPI003645431B